MMRRFKDISIIKYARVTQVLGYFIISALFQAFLF